MHKIITYIHRIITYILKNKQEILISIGTIAAFLGTYGYHQLNQGGFLDSLYASLKLFTLDLTVPAGKEINMPIEISRWLSAVTVAGAIFNVFLLLGKHSYIKYRLKYLCDEHVIVCGAGLKGERLIEDILNKGMSVVVIDNDSNNPAIQILSEKGAIFINGNAADADVLIKAKLDRAKYLIAITGNDQTNLAIAQTCVSLKQASKDTQIIQCIVHVSDDALRRLIYQKHSLSRPSQNIDFRLFSFYECGAHEIIRDFFTGKIDRLSSFEDGNQRPLHLVLVGFGRIGKSIAVEAARMGGYSDDKKLSVSVLSKHADVHASKLHSNHSKLYELLDLKFFQVDVESLPDNFSQIMGEECQIDLVVVSLGDELSNFKTAHAIQERFTVGQSSPPIYICGNGELGELLDPGAGIKNYSMLEEVCTFSVVVNPHREAIARLIHSNYETGNYKTPTSVMWQKLPLEKKDSNRDQAEHIEVKLKMVGCELANFGSASQTELTEDEVQKLARVEHSRWVSERILQGWSYDPVRDDANKHHPCLVSYDDLSNEDKEKDVDAVRKIPSFIATQSQVIARAAQ